MELASSGNSLSYSRGKLWKQRLFPNPVGRTTKTSLRKIPVITTSCSDFTGYPSFKMDITSDRAVDIADIVKCTSLQTRG